MIATCRKQDTAISKQRSALRFLLLTTDYRQLTIAIFSIVTSVTAVTTVPPAYAADSLYFIHTDHLGSTVAVTDEDGEIVSQNRHFPYGNDRFTDYGLRFTERSYTSQIKDNKTSLYYYNARYYDPALGTFVSADPAEDGLNRFGYARGNPLIFVDPTGQNVDDPENNLITVDDFLLLLWNAEYDSSCPLPMEKFLVLDVPNTGIVVVDTTHALSVAMATEHYLKNNPVPATNALLASRVNIFVAGTFFEGVSQPMKGWGRSSFSPEDMPSNDTGLTWGKDALENNKSLYEAATSWWEGANFGDYYATSKEVDPDSNIATDQAYWDYYNSQRNRSLSHYVADYPEVRTITNFEGKLYGEMTPPPKKSWWDTLWGR